MQRTFSRAGGAQETEYLPYLHRERHVGEKGLFGVTECQILDFDHIDSSLGSIAAVLIYFRSGCRLIDKINLIFDPFVSVIPKALGQTDAQKACVRVFVIVDLIVALAEYFAQLRHYLRVFLVAHPAQVFTDTVRRKVFDNDANGHFEILSDLQHLIRGHVCNDIERAVLLIRVHKAGGEAAPTVGSRFQRDDGQRNQAVLVANFSSRCFMASSYLFIS